MNGINYKSNYCKRHTMYSVTVYNYTVKIYNVTKNKDNFLLWIRVVTEERSEYEEMDW